MEDELSDELKEAINYARKAIKAVSGAFNTPRTKNPTAAARGQLTYWNGAATRHLASIVELSSSGDLAMVAVTHQRQILEIFLQVRHFLSFPFEERDYLAEKISACGAIDYLEKLKSVKDNPIIQPGYNEVSEQLTKYDPEIINEIRIDREQRRFNWFGSYFSQLAEESGKENENLKAVYQLLSAESHGVIGPFLDITSPAPNQLDVRGYSTKTELDNRAVKTLNQATRMYLVMWEKISEDVGASMYLEEDIS